MGGMNQFAGRSDDMDFTSKSAPLPNLTDRPNLRPDLARRLDSVRQTPSQPEQKPSVRYHTGNNISLTTMTGVAVEGRLGLSRGSTEFHVGGRTYHPLRMREAITLGYDESKERPYMEVKK